MKQLKYILILAIFASACTEEFTDLAPISQRNVENFYKTESDIRTGVNAIYSVLQQDGCYNDSYWTMFEMRSDNTDNVSESGLASVRFTIDAFEDEPTNEVITNAYTTSYLGVARANIILSRIGEVNMDANLKNQYTGEALFLRSLFYYHLALAFGNVPLVLDETKSVDEGLEHRQVPASAVFDQLIADLTQAESLLPVKYTGANVGRATKGAAAALLGKVLLTVNKKGEAATVLRRIVSSYGYTLLSDYAKLWGVENENNAESIFEVQYQGGLGSEGNRFTNDFSASLPTSVSGYRNRPTMDLMRAYEPGDLRFAASIDTFYIDNSGRPHSSSTDNSRWTIKYGKTNPFNEGDAPNNFVVLRYADVLLMLAEAIGESAEAYSLINQVRNRAGLGNIDASTPGTFAQKLLKERQVELAFENHRWADLLRFGVAETVMRAHGKNPRLLFYIPQRELDLNPNFKQNN
jgi:hypothetical protein